MTWLAVDWGTSRLRIWRDGAAEALTETAQGMNTLGPEDYGPILEPFGADTAVICGMAGARQGWREASYAAVPCAPSHAPLTFASGATTVHILPGLSQSSPADVMRGEETQIAGFLALNEGWDGVICLPGTHTKWVHVSSGEVVSFQTYLTGELFALLSEHSVLRHSLTPGNDADAYLDAVETALSKPAALAAQLFRLRAENLLHDLDPVTAHARASGLLIGAELAAAKPYWLGQQVAVIGSGPMADNYAAALTATGAAPARADATDVTLAGLTAAYEAFA
ncbi:MAG: 2-dehydro-3-deoxygalactonokinase [Pseudomonadota bacterium]